MRTFMSQHHTKRQVWGAISPQPRTPHLVPCLDDLTSAHGEGERLLPIIGAVKLFACSANTVNERPPGKDASRRSDRQRGSGNNSRTRARACVVLG
jgi:hypothetical protein